jgi:serine/threonine protein kinase
VEMLQLLKYVHSQRLIHRDIKPQNIIRCQTDNRLVLIDFGAVFDQESSKVRDHRLNKAIGTPGYAPPEQVAERPTYASDLYALGMTCIFMLTGQEPVAWKIDPQTCEVIWQGDVTVSESFAEILNRMVKVPLADRYQSAIQVGSALHNQQLHQKLNQYTTSKTALHAISGDLEETRVNYLPPAVQWAMQMSGR